MQGKGIAWNWRVETEDGIIETRAETQAKAERNARWRVVMGGRNTNYPTVRDKIAMRDLVIYKTERIDG